jgi:hypothetical protein
MSARKTDPAIFSPSRENSPETRLSLPANAVRIRRNGIEFLSAKPMPVWSEMTIELHSDRADGKVRANGVVIECNGSRAAGYSVSIMFLKLSRQAEAGLSLLAQS